MRDNKDTLTNTQALMLHYKVRRDFCMRLQYVRPAHFQHESKDQGIAALIYLNSNIFFVLIILKETEKVEQSFY